LRAPGVAAALVTYRAGPGTTLARVDAAVRRIATAVAPNVDLVLAAPRVAAAEEVLVSVIHAPHREPSDR
ncbi:MAG TPA: hypothetical protein VD838_20965, partial [Anaeromyxobacteraceae bacterium]|nr:hypothetical protein [Anaeromyxobacteraceae bacterium]